MIEVPFVTKLLPPRPRADLISRSALLQRLRQGQDLRLQVLSCGAGYGKTTLLAELVHGLDVPTCWYNLEPSDSDPKVLFTYLLAGLQKALPSLADQLQELHDKSLASQEPTALVGRLVTLLHNSGAAKMVLVLDDLHAIEGSPADQKVIVPLVERAPRMLRIIVGSRTLPSLSSLPRLLVQREAAIFREPDLRLSSEEVAQLLTVLQGKPCSTADAEAIAESTQGWAAGVVLMSLAGESASLAMAAGPGEELFRYLAVEVLERQPDDLRAFMLQTSVLDELTPEGCTALTQRADSERLLEEMARRNTFLARVSGPAFRYHQLFRAFLRETLRRQDPAAFASLNLEAGRHFQRLGQVEPAVGHYLNAGEPLLAARVLSSVTTTLFDRGQWHTLARLIDALPKETLKEEPQLLVVRGQLASRLGAPMEATEFLNVAVARFEEKGQGLDLVSALMARSIALRFQGAHQEAVKDARRALGLAGSLGGPAQLRASAHRQMGMAYGHGGLFRRARRHFLQAVKLLDEKKGGLELGLAHGFLGMVYMELGELPKAVVHYRKASQIWRRLDNLGELAETLNNMATLLQTQGQFQAAQKVASEAVDLAQKTGYTRVEAMALLTLGDALLSLDAPQEALESYQKGLDRAHLAMEAQAIAYGTAALGECYRLLGQRQTSAIFLKQAAADAESRQQPYELGYYLSSLGALANDEGDVRAGADLLQKACNLLEKAGHRRALALAHFQLANSRFLARSHGEALKELKTVGALCAALGSSAFLLPQARHAQGLLQYAALREAGGTPVQELARTVLPQLSSPASPALPSGAPESVRVKAYAFGSGSVWLNGGEVGNRAWESAKAKELLFFLLCSQREARKEELVAALWPDSEITEANSAFHSALHRVRRALLPDAVVYAGGKYTLNPAWGWWLDSQAFDSLLKETGRHSKNDPQRLAKMQEAVDLYKGPLLEWCYGDWCATPRRQSQEQYLGALLGLAEHHTQQAQWRRAIGVLSLARAEDPLREPVVMALMRCYASLGDSASLLSAAEQYRRTLREEVDAEPSQAFNKLQQELRASPARS